MRDIVALVGRAQRRGSFRLTQRAMS
jgi:hypothetical protein